MRQSAAKALAVAAFGLALASTALPAIAQAPADEDSVAAEAPSGPSPTVLQLADWVAASHDSRDLPFVIVDKAGATVAAFDAAGQLLGAEPALLGLAHGDDSVPGIGDRPMSKIRPSERTTPAGRFLAGFGPSAGQGRVLWVDYATAISLHPVVTANPKERRLQRLKSPSADDNRITYGCINVSRAFYDQVVRPLFNDSKGVVYVLPETKTVAEVFPTFALAAERAAEPQNLALMTTR